MRTSHSSAGRAAAAAQPRMEFPEELAPVFVVAAAGPERALLLRLLDSHPAVHARDDDALESVKAGAEVRSAVAGLAAGAVEDASMSLRRGAASPLRVFCTPLDPARGTSIDSAVAALPEARALCLLRDGREVIVAERMAALAARDFSGLSARGRAEAEGAAAFVLGRSAVPARLFCAESLRLHTMRWVGSLRASLRATELLRERARLVRFEELSQETIRTVGGTCRWLGVAGDAAQVHSAIEACRTSLAGVKSAGAWRGLMGEADRTGFKRMAGELLIELGYENNLRW